MCRIGRKINGCLGLWVEGRVTVNIYGVSFWGNETILKLDFGVGCTVL